MSEMPDKELDRGKENGPLFLSPEKPPKPSKVSIDEIGQLRKIFEDSKLAKWIIWAGIGGMVELARLLWDILHSAIDKGLFK